MSLPTDRDARNALPIWDGLMMYFPDVWAEVAKVSVLGNKQHNLGAKLFYRRGSFMEPAPSTLVLARAYHEAAQHLSRSLIDIAGRNTPDKLVVSLPPGLARLPGAGPGHESRHSLAGWPHSVACPPCHSVTRHQSVPGRRARSRTQCQDDSDSDGHGTQSRGHWH